MRRHLITGRLIYDENDCPLYAEWTLNGLARLLNNRGMDDGISGWQETLQRLACRIREVGEDQGEARYGKQLQEASAQVVALASEIDYRRFGELVPSGD